jgi:itaconate CoA-transferase
MMTGDLGARIIKVEDPAGGDFARHYDSAVNGLSAHFAWLNRNKESLAIDLKHADAQAVLARLLPRADVVIQNLAPGAAQRLGIDADSLVIAHPRLVAVDISGYGEDGPISHRRAYDLLVQAEGGSCAVTGWPDRPAKPGIPLADLGTGSNAALGILAALFARAATGRGCALKVSMFDTVADLMGFALLYSRYTGHDRTPNGMGSPMVAPYGAYRTRDGQTVVLGTTNDREWRRLATDLLARPDLAADPKLATNDQRGAMRAELDALIGAWTRQHDLVEVCRLADQAAIGNARFNSPSEVITHPQLVDRHRWTEVGSPVGPLASLLPPIISSDWATPLAPIPSLGEHTVAIAKELGVDSKIIDRLSRAR